ncbi:chorismate synthase, partial [Mediterraneibacter gnavus]
RGFNDVRGGGHFSGRITAPVVFAGAIAKQILAKQGIQIGAHILSIKNEYDENFDMRLSTKTLEYLRRQHYPVINQEKYEKFVNIVDAARMDQDS